MRIIDTFWDNNVTGLRTCELIFETGDSVGSYLDTGVENHYGYCVIKIPAGDLHLVHGMEDQGYRYLENQLNISFSVDQLNSVEESWNRDLSGFSSFPITENSQLELLLKEVSSGMFENDRFSLDPFWKKDVSSSRYGNWIRQMYSEVESRLYVMKKNGTEVGFFSLRNLSPQRGSCPLAGIFRDFKSHGYFFTLALLWLRESKARGYKELVTSISTNNKPIHSFLSRYFSFKIEETLIVMRKVTA